MPSLWNRMSDTLHRAWLFVSEDVWKSKSDSVWVHIVKTLNLSVRCFLDERLQEKAAALTYQTLLAIVPALALLFAIGKGFGFQSIIYSQLFDAFPAQREALSHAYTFVEAYMTHMKDGVFVGVGIILLLWTMISLLGTIEKTFNDLWNVPNRKLSRQVTDYMAMFILLPVLLVAANGMSIFVTAILEEMPLVSPWLHHIMQALSYVLSWLFFMALYIFLPNTKVQFKHAAVSAVICGTAFNLFQALYIAGQIWVSRYNAIYGSFAFLPLLMLWVPLSWLICLFGVVLSYSSQNVFNFEFEKEIKNISRRYYEYVVLIIMTIIESRRRDGLPPLTKFSLSQQYDLPIQLVSRAIEELVDVGLLLPTPTNDDYAYIATIDSAELTVGSLLRRLNEHGCSGFVASIGDEAVDHSLFDEMDALYYRQADKVLVADMPLPALIADKHVTNH